MNAKHQERPEKRMGRFRSQKWGLAQPLCRKKEAFMLGIDALALALFIFIKYIFTHAHHRLLLSDGKAEEN